MNAATSSSSSSSSTLPASVPAALEQTARRFAALAQETRLGVFWLLVRAGPEGMTAGAIAETLDVAASTLSAHLGQLRTAGLVVVRRRGRHLIYGVDYQGARALLGFFTRDCCQGRPEICADLLSPALPLFPEAPPDRPS